MPDMIVSSLANTRLARGGSQAALAERARVSRAEISAIETGRLMPSVTVALRLAESSLQEPGVRVGSDTRDWRANIKAGFTPNATDEYTINHTTQSGAKGAPLNVYNNPPVPPNSYWRWPWWDVRSTSVLTSTQLGSSTYVKSRT